MAEEKSISSRRYIIINIYKAHHHLNREVDQEVDQRILEHPETQKREQISEGKNSIEIMKEHMRYNFQIWMALY